MNFALHFHICCEICLLFLAEMCTILLQCQYVCFFTHYFLFLPTVFCTFLHHVTFCVTWYSHLTFACVHVLDFVESFYPCKFPRALLGVQDFYFIPAFMSILPYTSVPSICMRWISCSLAEWFPFALISVSLLPLLLLDPIKPSLLNSSFTFFAQSMSSISTAESARNLLPFRFCVTDQKILLVKNFSWHCPFSIF